MALENRLDLRLSQRLILTPQLQQAIKLLQMPQLELAQVLNQELVENPFLEEVADEVESEAYTEREEQVPSSSSSEGEMGELSFEGVSHFSVDDYFDERGSDGRDLGYFTLGMEEQPSYELFYSKSPSLSDHLLWQLRLSSADDTIRKVAEVVVGNIDEDGYLRATEEEVRETAGAEDAIVKAAIELVQSFDPQGVGARDLRESLLLQVNALGLKGTLVENIVLSHLEDLQKKRYGIIARQYGVVVSDVVAAVKIIEKLEPRPASGISATEVSYVVPDVYIVMVEDEYQIRLNDEYVPKLGLNRRLVLTAEERDYLKQLLTQKYEALTDKSEEEVTLYRKIEKRLSTDRVNLLFSIRADERKVLNELLTMHSAAGITHEEKGVLREKINTIAEVNSEEKSFLRDKFRVANELIEGINQRSKTIYKVSESILKFQQEFFDKGIQYLKPLNLKDIATDIEMHESTISRVTSNKFLSCSHGVFSFRYFFSSAIQSDTGGVSSTLVKDLIRRIIMEEDPKKPMSDQMIADKLRGENITIARRTVAKYREELKISPQCQRKKIEYHDE